MRDAGVRRHPESGEIVASDTCLRSGDARPHADLRPVRPVRHRVGGARSVLGHESGHPGLRPPGDRLLARGCEARADHVRRTLAELAGLATARPTTTASRKDFLTERFGSMVDVHDSGRVDAAAAGHRRAGRHDPLGVRPDVARRRRRRGTTSPRASTPCPPRSPACVRRSTPAGRRRRRFAAPDRGGRRAVRARGPTIGGSTRCSAEAAARSDIAPATPQRSPSGAPTAPSRRSARSPATSATTTSPDADAGRRVRARALRGQRRGRCTAPTSIRPRCTTGRGTSTARCATRSCARARSSSPAPSFAEVRDLLDNDPGPCGARRRRVPRVAAGDDRRRARPRRRALRHPRADEPVRGAHPAGGLGRGAVLHRAVGGLQPARPHVVPDARPHQLPDVG